MPSLRPSDFSHIINLIKTGKCKASGSLEVLIRGKQLQKKHIRNNIYFETGRKMSNVMLPMHMEGTVTVELLKDKKKACNTAKAVMTQSKISRKKKEK